MNRKTLLPIAVLLLVAVPFSALQRGRGQRAGRGQPPKLNATTYNDVSYVTNGHSLQKLTLYIPKSKNDRKTPLIILIHGGAFRGGDMDTMNPAPFLDQGFAAASINYRLSGDAIFPAQIEDCKAAVRWLRHNAEKYNLDPDRFGVWGTSAGGHLAAMLGTTAETRLFDVGENLDVSSRVQAVADWFGPTDFLQMDEHRTANGMAHNPGGSPESKLIGGPIQQNKEKVAKANPITYITDKTPPFLIAHGDSDRLVPHHQSELLFAALQKAGTPVTFYTVKGGGHGFRNATADDMRNKFFLKYLK
jgi:acetyl esterase/lipase